MQLHEGSGVFSESVGRANGASSRGLSKRLGNSCQTALWALHLACDMPTTLFHICVESKHIHKPQQDDSEPPGLLPAF